MIERPIVCHRVAPQQRSCVRLCVCTGRCSVNGGSWCTTVICTPLEPSPVRRRPSTCPNHSSCLVPQGAQRTGGDWNEDSTVQMKAAQEVCAYPHAKAWGTPLRTACHGVTLWSVWGAPPLPARASLPREGRSPRAHRVHGIPMGMEMDSSTISPMQRWLHNPIVCVQPF